MVTKLEVDLILHVDETRAEMVEFLQVRALNCNAGQIIVTSGAQQGHDLVARVLLDVGNCQWRS